MRIITLGFFLCSFVCVSAQNIGIGTWRSHLSYRESLDITGNNGVVLVRTSGGIFSYDLSDNSITKFSSVSGLRRASVSAIRSLPSSFVVGYKEGQIDIITEDEIIQIDDIVKSAFEEDKKKVSNITLGNNRVCVSTGFGVVRFDATSLKVKDTFWQLGENGEELAVFAAVENDEYIVVATENGLMIGSLDPMVNLLDFNNWSRFPILGVSENLARIGNKVYATIDGDGLYELNGSSWTKVDFDGETFYSLKEFSNGLVLCGESGCFNWDSNAKSEITFTGQGVPKVAWKDDEGNVWIGSDIGFFKQIGASHEKINPDGPYSTNSWKIKTIGNSIFGLSGGFDLALNALMNSSGMYRFNGDAGNWVNYNRDEDPQYAGLDDVMDVVYKVSSGELIVATYENKLFTVSTDGDIFPYSNSLPSDARIGALHYDQSSLWAVLIDDISPLWHEIEENSWESFVISGAPPLVSKDITSDSDYLYILIDPTAGNGIVMFDKASGESRILSTERNEGDLPGRPTAMVMDRHGDLWTGTTNGVAFFSNPSFSNDINAFTPISLNVPLLRGEQINGITVDGGNRKWITTSKGVWLVSEDGEEVIHHFDITNSPLLSNISDDVAIIGSSGEVFFDTEGGIISYRSGASTPELDHSNVVIFPNPVPKDFMGTVGINGLVSEANIKITDVSGRLIYETVSNGGTATWDVRSYNSNHAGTGIYFVYSSNADGSETFIGKIAVIK